MHPGRLDARVGGREPRFSYGTRAAARRGVDRRRHLSGRVRSRLGDPINDRATVDEHLDPLAVLVLDAHRDRIALEPADQPG